MRLNVGNLTIRNLIISYILLYSIMPIVSRLTSTYLTTYFYMVVVVLLVILILVLDRPENLNEYGTFLLPFIIYALLTRFISSEDIVMWGYQTLLFWLPVILGYYFTQDTSRIQFSYSKLIVVAMIITMITTIIGCINNPNAARDLATVSSQDDISSKYDMLNIGGYNFVYYLVLLYPVLILAYKARKIKLLPTIIITFVILLTVVYAEYTTALLLFIISSVLFFTRRNLSARGIIIISIFSILFLFVFSNVIVEILHSLSNIIDSEAVAHRLDALAGGTAGLEASEDKRLYFYQKSFNVFLSHPFFGVFVTGDISLGGHSYILDNLAQFGAVGGILMFFMYKNIFTRFFLPYKEQFGFGYIIWTFIQIIILSFVNTGMWLDVLCLFCPILFYWIYGIDTNTVKESQDKVSIDPETART